jgi:hypothetical protein
MSEQPSESGTRFESTQPEPAAPESDRRRRKRGEGSWIVGVVLIVLGGIFLLQNQGLFSLQNWWALFILIPALGSLSDAWRHYQEAGGFTSKVRNSLFWGLVLIMVCAIFLLDLSWTYFGPAILILIGLGILFNALLPGDKG